MLCTYKVKNTVHKEVNESFKNMIKHYRVPSAYYVDIYKKLDFRGQGTRHSYSFEEKRFHLGWLSIGHSAAFCMCRRAINQRKPRSKVLKPDICVEECGARNSASV